MSVQHQYLFVILFAVSIGACRDDPATEAAPHFRSAVEPPIVRQTVSAGEYLTPLTLARVQRTNAELASRADQFAQIIANPGVLPDPRSPAQQALVWASSSLESPYVLSVDKPLPNHPNAIVEYLPHADWLRVLATDGIPSVTPVPSSETETRSVAWDVVNSLLGSGLINSGQYGVVGAGRTRRVDSVTNIPFISDYTYQFMEFVDGFPIRNSAVEVRVAADATVQSIGVKQVQVQAGTGGAGSAPPVAVAERSSEATMDAIRGAVEAEITAIRPTYIVSFSEPIPAYELPDDIEVGSTAEVLPRLFVRGAASDSTHVTKGFLMASGFQLSDTPTQVDPRRKPLMCKGFQPADYVSMDGGEAHLDSELIDRVMQRPVALEVCERARLSPQPEGDAMLVGIEPDGLLAAIGFVEGDREIEICADNGTATGKDCLPLSDGPSLHAALLRLAGTTNFLVRLEREGSGPTELRMDVAADGEGDPCVFDSNCPPGAPYCVDFQCHDGSQYDPCVFGSDCSVAPFCVDSLCQYGFEDDPCVFDSDCDPSSPFCGPDKLCHDGSFGDPCVFDSDCDAVAPICMPTGTCSDGAPGDPCTFDTDCDASAPFCVDGACRDGTAGAACVFDNDCESSSPHCVGQVCREGEAGDPCVFTSDCEAPLSCSSGSCA